MNDEHLKKITLLRDRMEKYNRLHENPIVVHYDSLKWHMNDVTSWITAELVCDALMMKIANLLWEESK